MDGSDLNNNGPCALHGIDRYKRRTPFACAVLRTRSKIHNHALLLDFRCALGLCDSFPPALEKKGADRIHPLKANLPRSTTGFACSASEMASPSLSESGMMASSLPFMEASGPMLWWKGSWGMWTVGMSIPFADKAGALFSFMVEGGVREESWVQDCERFNAPAPRRWRGVMLFCLNKLALVGCSIVLLRVNGFKAFSAFEGSEAIRSFSGRYENLARAASSARTLSSNFCTIEGAWLETLVAAVLMEAADISDPREEVDVCESSWTGSLF